MSYPNQFSPQQNNPFLRDQQAKSGPPWTWIVLGGLGLGGVMLGIMCCGGLVTLLQPPKASAAAKQPFSVTEVPVPTFGDRENAEEFEPGVMLQMIPVGPDQEGGFYSPPGHGGYLMLHLPAGQHPPQSLPCILITGAGTTLLSGVDLEGEGNPDEYIPYVKAGYAVLAYDMDGPDYSDGDPAEMNKAFQAFKASRAGLVNGRNALEYALTKCPEIDPKQIYAAGHSSAATHALLLAAHEPRLAGVIAYAPAADLPKWFGPRMRVMSMMLPGMVDFVTQSSPGTHASRIKCPTFLFHAEDDTICEIAQTRAFADTLKQQGTAVELVTVATGDHYDSMIDEGIPAAVRWLGTRTKK